MVNRFEMPLIVALGTNDKILEDINKVFSKREYIYEKVLKEEQVNLEYISLYSVRYKKSLRQVHAILRIAERENNFDIINSLIKKGFKKIYKYVTETPGPLNYKNMLYIRRQLKSIDVTETENLIFCSIFLYIDLINPVRKISNKESKKFEYILDAYYNLTRTMLDFSNMKINKQRKYTFNEQEENLLNYLYKTYTVDKKFILKHFSHNLISQAINKWEENYNYVVDTSSNVSKAASQICEYQDEILENEKGNGALAKIIDNTLITFGFYESKNIYILNELETKVLFSNIVKYYHLYNLQDTYEIEVLLLAITPALQLKKEYDVAVELYSATLIDDLKKEVREQYQEEVEQLKHGQQQLQQENSALQEQVRLLQEQKKNAENIIKSQRKKLYDLSEMQSNYENLKQEAIALRNYSYTMVTQKTEKKDIKQTLEQMVNELNKRRLVIIGGTVNWQNKMKNLLKEAKFIAIDKQTSYELLQTPDTLIAINTLANKHSNYEKVLSMRNKDNIICYLNDVTNVELSVKYLYDNIVK